MQSKDNKHPDGGVKTKTNAGENGHRAQQGSRANTLEAPHISLPKGGGAIKGIDEKFEVNAANGTAVFSLPLPFSPARNGFMPAIALGYNSGAGNGIFGLGWDLGFPSIQRKTDKQLPRYLDSEESDVFLFSGAEDLVPALRQDAAGDWTPDEISVGPYSIRRYRPRIEGGFARIEKITHPDHGVWWKVTGRDNTLTYFGKTEAYRIADPTDGSRIFQWLPELSFDNTGNCVLYAFKAENGQGYGAAVFDTNRFLPDGSPRFINRYLKRVYYCPRRPYQPFLAYGEPADLPADVLYRTANPVAGDFLMELVLDYGEHGPQPHGPLGQVEVSYADTSAWYTRHDAFSTYRAGFEIRTARLCRRALLFHHFAELGSTPCLVRSLDLQYRDWALQEQPEAGKKLEVTYLVAATQRSYIRQDGHAYRFRGLPPVEFGYQELAWDKTVHIINPESVVHAPAGLSAGYQWVDLYNEGISGILSEQGEGWFYKENLGEGQFAPAKPVIPKPSLMGIGTGVLQLQDLEADGRKQVVVNSPGLNGYFELADDSDWACFRPFEQLANVDLRDPNTRLLDLNGDGRPEIVVTEENAFSWYPAAGLQGYDAPETAPKPFDEEQGPAILFADGTQSIFLADMGGDGLTDIVRIRNGEVCYWPNLGYGRFGAKVTMHNSPWFDAPDLFNPAYLQLSDVSGTGATDLIYLGKNQFRAWLNLSGNGWSAPCDIEPFFDTAPPNQISIVDLLGNGTSCIVWSSPLPGNTGEPLRYIDLMGGQKPHVLTSYTNNLGKTTTWHYKSSTHFYLEDKKAGKPWITRLPFPVQVVHRVTVEDKWRNTRFSNQYSYHHGYYDHPEREFRGFGRVEQTDVEDFGVFAAGNEHSPYITQDKTLYQPPVKTIRWYHTGAFMNQHRILNQFAAEYFQPNGGAFYENELPEPDLDAEGLGADAYREALRACKGMVLRTETYELAVDDVGHVTDRRTKLFSTAFHNCHIRRLQPRANNRHSIFLVTESEAITYHYELPLEHGIPMAEADPRIAHTLNLRMDELGNVLQAVVIGYPRWRGAALEDPLLPTDATTLIQTVQQELHLVYTENQFSNDAITRADYRLRVPCEVRTYALSGFQPRPGYRYFTLADWRAYPLEDNSSVENLPYHQLPDEVRLQKRMVERVRMLYFDTNLRDPLPFGQVNRLGLLYETYQLALTEDLLTAVIGEKLPTLQAPGETRTVMLARVLAEGGYHTFPGEPGQWWIRSGIAGFQPDAAAHFYLPERYTDPFGNPTILEYDPYDLYFQRSMDAMGNTVRVIRFDFRVLAPLEMEDLNGNSSEVAFDILGMPAAMAIKGKGSEADNLLDFDEALLHPDGETLRRFFTGDYEEMEAQRLLGNATARHLYYLGETVAPDGRILYAQHPACSAGMLREIHVAEGGTNSPLHVAFEYSDGSGTVLTTKTQAEPETTSGSLRWIANGKTVLNNKGKPVKQYEPYFSANGHRFEEPREVGVTPIIYYDAAGRAVRTELPDGTVNRVAFSPWFVRTFDANDTVLESQWFLDRGGHPGWVETTEAPTDPGQRAAFLAKIHANTPAETHLDSLGREVVAVAHNRFRRRVGNDFVLVEDKYLTYTKLDAEGKPLWIQDARGNRVMEYINRPGADTDYAPCYDLAGNLLFQHSMDGGDRWMLPDSTGQPCYAWDLNEGATDTGELLLENRLYHTRYDPLRRPVEVLLQINGGTWHSIERFEYRDPATGTTAPDFEALARNLGGQAYRHYDAGSLTTQERFDFKGNLLETTRQLAEHTTAAVLDWATESPSTEVFTQRTRYDALNRMTQLDNWQVAGQPPAVYTPQYNRRGVLVSERLTVRGAPHEAIQHIEYNAKGQRTRLRLGNGTTTRYDYDPQTFRLTRLLSTGRAGSEVLQDLRYTYDPSGNITQVEDLSQDILFFRNSQVKPVQTYEYDALYRLLSATGREHAANTAPGPGPYPFGPLEAVPSDHTLRMYTQYYTYDPVGNFLDMRHVANGGSWTRHYETAPDSNRLLRTWLGDDEAGAVHYIYDTHGSMCNLANSPAEYHLRWDYRDMIHSAQLGGGGRAWYQYDAGKQRTRKRIERGGGIAEERIYLGGMERYRRWAGSALVEEIETHHLFADDQRVLIAEDVRTTGGDLPTGLLLRYQYGNHLGSVGLELDAEGRVLSYEEYHPYGTTAYQARNAAMAAAAKRYRYTGMERDEETGLSYHTARYYVGWLGRWGSVDPIGVEGGGGLYEYARSNPIQNEDATGTQATTPHEQELGMSLISEHQEPDQSRDGSSRATSVEMFNPNSIEDWGRVLMGAAEILGEAAYQAVQQTLLQRGIRGLIAFIPAAGQAIVGAMTVYDLYQLLDALPRMLSALGDAADHIRQAYERLRQGEGLSMEDATLLVTGAIVIGGALLARRVAPQLSRRLSDWWESRRTGSTHSSGHPTSATGSASASVDTPSSPPTSSSAAQTSHGSEVEFSRESGMMEIETRDRVPLGPNQVVDEMNQFLGPVPHSDINPQTGVRDMNRIFSADGQRSIRYGQHEMSSRPTRQHYHEETWGVFNDTGEPVVYNRLRRFPEQPRRSSRRSRP